MIADERHGRISGNPDERRSMILRRLVFTLALAVLPLVRAAPLSATVSLKASYNETADLFSLMDNVSGWLPGFTDSAYREEWTRRFGWSQSDQEWADRYSEYRHRTYSDPSQGILPATSPDGLFAPSAANTAKSDPLATFLLGQLSVTSALAQLRSVAAPADAAMLKGFYEHFAPKWRTILTESSTLAANAKVLHEQLNTPGAVAFVARVSRFYRVSVAGNFQALFVWSPPGPRSTAEVVAGRYFLIHVPPNQASSDNWDGVAMHELIHYISAHQPPEQKKMLTMQFLARCPEANRPKALRLLEEPLAVAWGQAAYAKYARANPVNWNERWYAIPQVDLLGHLLWPTVDQLYNTDATIIDGIVDDAAKRCAVLFGAVKALE